MEINYKVQNYAWGKRGSNSMVAELYANSNNNIKIDEKTPYAELWLGTHVNGPSTLKTGELLSDFIAKKPEVLGDKIRQVYGDHLPFLFKVLSVNEALSIQAHPSKQHAEELHRKHPDIYKDPNHKPEMAIALTEFEVLCGFRPIPEIFSFFKKIPELKVVVGNILEQYDANKDNTDLLKIVFKTILTTPKDSINEQLSNLAKRLKTLGNEQRKNLLAELFERLYKIYPNDGGCFMIYLFNYIVLQPYQAIYLGANEPHCYLFGDCVECMACSDNVVRAGLTPKLIDVDTLCSMLIYKGEEPKQKIFKPTLENNHTKIFKPPVTDFAVIQMIVPDTVKIFKIRERSSASILLVISGVGKLNKINLTPGTAVFLPADTESEITDINQDLLLYQSLANL